MNTKQLKFAWTEEGKSKRATKNEKRILRHVIIVREHVRQQPWPNEWGKTWNRAHFAGSLTDTIRPVSSWITSLQN